VDRPALSAVSPAGRARILHVDDNEATRYVVTRVLREAGFDVLEAGTGRGALEALARRPDLVILDVRLPDLSGFDVCRRIKADPQTRHVPVLILTAVLVASRHKVEGLESGADGYLVHPVEPLVLIATVRALLRIREGEEALRTLNETLERRVAERTADLLAHQRRLRHMVAEQGRAEQRERQRLAAELHDNLVQLLAVCKIRVSALAAPAARADPATVAREATAVKGFLDEGIAYARSLMAELGPVPVNDHDLGAGLESIAAGMERHGLRVRVVDDGRPVALDSDAVGVLYRSVRELLFNVVKHAGTREATVTMERSGRELLVTVSDTGHGFDAAARPESPPAEGGYGLVSIRERLDLFGARLEIESAPGRGTRVAITVPTAEATEAGE
jgi:signal transduction histidine kinase